MASKPFFAEPLTSYKRWVAENPARATEMETIIKWLSYFAAGKINKSIIVSELVYSASNLFSLYNDTLISRSQINSEHPPNVIRDKLKLCLTILHYCEVFVEISSRHKWGKKGKWSAATIIQIVRCLSNLVLIYQYSEIPVSQPPIPVLQRKKFTEQEAFEDLQDSGFVLRRSGRLVRRVEAAPPVVLRDWKPLQSTSQDNGTVPNLRNDVTQNKLAETLYAIKPLMHLTSVACFGSESWKQWLTFLGCDLVSLHLYNKNLLSLNSEQREEINRRKLSLIFYLLRSPVYHKYSCRAINQFLTNVSKKIPLANIICNPILEYIPQWQDTYFYLWAN